VSREPQPLALPRDRQALSSRDLTYYRKQLAKVGLTATRVGQDFTRLHDYWYLEVRTAEGPHRFHNPPEFWRFLTAYKQGRIT
jgi:hypothetical protein